jgi:uncharacterized membrane protein
MKHPLRLNPSLVKTTFAGLTLLSLASSSALAANWTITDLGALGAEHSLNYTSKACNINNAGQVAGQGVVLVNGEREMHYVMWSNGTQIDLGIRGETSVAPINDAGQVAGVIAAENYSPFLWQAGVVTRVPVLPNTVDGCRVTGINAGGAVVGNNGVQRTWGVERVSVRWHGGVVADLGLPYGYGVTAINDSGTLAIGAGQMGQRSYVLSGGNTSMVDWPGMDPLTGTTKALDLNNAGQVCGWLIDPAVDGAERALLWQAGGGTFLPNFPINSRSEAVALNNHGHAVGWAYRAGNDAPAVLWRDGTLTALDSLPEVKAAGWSALEARDINDHDQIVGSGYHGEFVHAFLLSPVVVPTLTLTRSGTDVVLSFPTQTGVLYQLQSSTDLIAESWLDVGAPYSGTGGVLSPAITIGPEPKKFFRLHLGN